MCQIIEFQPERPQNPSASRPVYAVIRLPLTTPRQRHSRENRLSRFAAALDIGLSLALGSGFLLFLVMLAVSL